MNCGMDCIKYLIFIFNFVFALGGLAILIVGVLIKLNQTDVLSILDNIPSQLSLPASVLIAIGAIIFIIAFFGCCGAARESHCMIVTFAVLLLTLLVIQVAIAAFTFIKMNDGTFDDQFNKQLDKLYQNYYKKDKAAENTVNSIQTLMSCCGYNGPQDFIFHGASIPYSCCGKTSEKDSCSMDEVLLKSACNPKVVVEIHRYVDALGGLALGIAAVELIGVIFSFCLANSIRNTERRGYKV